MNSVIKKISAPLFLAIAMMGCSVQAGEPSAVSTDAQPGVPEGWITDYDAALKQAKAENKDVFIDFTGSDWCGWCKKLDQEVFSTEAFKDYAKEKLILVYADFPRGKAQSDALKEQNEKLAKQFGIRGFPTVIVLNSDGKPVGQMGYMRGGPDAFLGELKRVTNES